MKLLLSRIEIFFFVYFEIYLSHWVHLNFSKWKIKNFSEKEIHFDNKLIHSFYEANFCENELEVLDSLDWATAKQFAA